MTVLPARWQSSPQVRVAAVVLECFGAVALATTLVAVLKTVAPVTSLGVLYLLAVLFAAIRRGMAAGLATAVLSVLALNFLFIEPRYRLTIADSDNVVALAVFLIVAVVVGRLAADQRRRAAEAESRARLAAAREREAKMLAEAASAVLAGADIDAQLRNLAASVEATAGGHLRIELRSAPSRQADELTVPLRLKGRSAWLHARGHAGWMQGDLERIAQPLARLIDVAFEHEQIREHSAEAEAARRADVAKTALLHAISHDLRSPLTAITTAAGALGHDDLSAAERKELVSVIDTESARLGRLVDDLLDLSRIQAGAVNPQPDWCDLQEVVVSASAHVQSMHGKHPIEIALSPDLPLVQADPSQLERVFSNLIENAIKFSPPEMPIRITGAVGSGRVTVRVIDRGRGIAPSKRAQIFEPFFRGRTAGQGSGLGLAICRGFVEANGGRIVLQSGTEEGTSFAVSFPLVRQPAHAA
jgi:two-component system sensor histidine kinase KdpD